MTHFYERNITEIKSEYTIFLVNVLSPLIYEGINGMYNEAKKIEEKFIKAQKQKPNIENPGVLKLFQKLLSNIPSLNNHHIENETIRLRDNSKIADIFDDLIRAVVKSNIVLLTYNASGKTCTLVKDRYHENIDIKDFIHKCYIECAKSFYNYPELFWHNYSTIDIQRNKRDAHKIIKKSINESIRKIIPMKLILEEYLSKDYIKEDNDITGDINNADYMNIKNMLMRDLYDKENMENKNILDDDSSDDLSDGSLDDDDGIVGGDNSDNNLENLIADNSTDDVNNIDENINDIDKGVNNINSDVIDNTVNNVDEEDDVNEEKEDNYKEVHIEMNGKKNETNRIFQNAITAMNNKHKLNDDKVEEYKRDDNKVDTISKQINPDKTNHDQIDTNFNEKDIKDDDNMMELLD
jgi:hypothetical protein